MKKMVKNNQTTSKRFHPYSRFSNLKNKDFFKDFFPVTPIVKQDKTFKSITSDYIIDNIKESNIPYYFDIVKESVIRTINNFKGNETLKFKLIITCEFTSPLAFDIQERHFNRPFEELLTMNNFDDIYSNIQEDFIAWIDDYEGKDYGFVFDKIIKTNIRLSKTNYLRASSYFDHDLGLRKGILNIRNKDQKCFSLAKIFPPERSNHTTRVSSYILHEGYLNMNNIEYPVKIKDISKFETQNLAISVNVFALEISDDINTLYPLYISNHKNREFEIDLLYLEKDGNTHYCLIKNLESLFSNNGNKVYICRNCMSCFTTSEAFRNHQEICLQHDYCKVKISNGKTLKFTKAHFKSRLPVVIYADFESMNIKLHTVKSSDSSSGTPSVNKSYSIPISKQEVISFGMYIKSDYNNLITTQYHTFTGYDAKEKFVETIIKIYNNISQKLYYYSNANKRVRLTHTQQQDFNQATHCYICNKEFNNKKTN